MEWRDFMRGFFGGRGQGGDARGGDQWPPPPPIEEFREERGAREEGNGFGGGMRARRGLEEEQGFSEFGGGGGFEEFGNRFVFGDVMSAVGEMFKEMERSMRDMDRFFGEFEGHPGGFGMIPFPNQTPIPALPEAPSKPTQKREDNIRDQVLKEPETPSRNKSWHYAPPPDSAKDKVDRDLDDLHQQSKLDLSELPVPSQTEQPSFSGGGSLLPFGGIFGGNSGGGGNSHSTFRRTYQTYSFKNGRWEGQVVKEDQNGKEVTRYYQDEQGQRHETTEYFPRGDGSSPSTTNPPPLAIRDSPSSSSENRRSLFPFFERFFKPKI